MDDLRVRTEAAALEEAIRDHDRPDHGVVDEHEQIEAGTRRYFSVFSKRAAASTKEPAGTSTRCRGLSVRRQADRKHDPRGRTMRGSERRWRDPPALRYEARPFGRARHEVLETRPESGGCGTRVIAEAVVEVLEQICRNAAGVWVEQLEDGTVFGR